MEPDGIARKQRGLFGMLPPPAGAVHNGPDPSSVDCACAACAVLRVPFHRLSPATRGFGTCRGGDRACSLAGGTRWPALTPAMPCSSRVGEAAQCARAACCKRGACCKPAANRVPGPHVQCSWPARSWLVFFHRSADDSAACCTPQENYCSMSRQLSKSAPTLLGHHVS